MAQRTKASIEIDVKGLKAVNDLLSKLNSIDSKVNKINRASGGKGGKDDFAEIQKVRNQISRIETKSLRIRNQLVGLNEKDRKVSAIKGRLTRAENKAKKGSLDIANRELAIAEKLLAKQKLSTAEIVKQNKASARMTAIRQGNFAGSGPGVFGPQPRPSFAQSIGIKRGFDFQSAAISGAFPLLFGQGPVGALAGGVGGGVGGMFGGMGGFAGGIAATAVVQQITTLTQEIGKLGNTLARPTENIGTLVEKLGLANDPAGKLALRLEKLGLVSSASSLLIEKFTEQTGKSPEALQKATKEINEMNKQLATLTLKFQLFAAEALTPIISLLNKVPYDQLVKLAQFRLNMSGAGAGAALSRQASKLGNVDFGSGKGRLFRPRGMSNIPAVEGNAVIGGVPLNPNFGKTSAQVGKISALEALANEADFNKNIRPLKQALEIEQKRLTLSASDLNLLQEKFKLTNLQNELKILESQANLQNNTELKDQIAKLKIVIDTQQQIVNNAEHLSSNFQKIGRSIASGITDNLSAAIMQTKTLGDAAKSILNDLSSTLIKLGVNTILGGLTGGAGGIFGGLPMLKFANGGRPPVGKASLVGERGPELFVPRRSGTIVPNDKLGGGSTNISVNVDASGSSVQGDEQQSKELGKAISAAIQSELLKQRRPGGLLR